MLALERAALTLAWVQHHIKNVAEKAGKIMSKVNKKTAGKPIYSVADAGRAAVEKARFANKNWAERRKEMRQGAGSGGSWKRETLALPRNFEKIPESCLLVGD